MDSDSRASSLRTQITKLKEECRQYKEEAETSKTRITMLEASNERLRNENMLLKNRHGNQQQRDYPSVPSVLKCSKNGAGDQERNLQAQTTKCVRFADDPSSSKRVKDTCIQAVGPSDAATQTSFIETAPALENHWTIESTPVSYFRRIFL